MYSIKNRNDLEKLHESASIQYQEEELRLQDKLVKQNFHENVKKIYEPPTDTIKYTSEFISKTTTQTSIKNEKALEKLKNKLLKILTDGGIIAIYLM